MQNNNLCLINFKVKLHRQRFFINEHNAGGSNFFFLLKKKI